ncbi:NAD(P)/FAD-dependent oxidoreductase [Niabella hibiscisoli]|uniref:NAD(P)/FAD-dependent oxidoreductase n=1 Tax=Niabella hibiscisoli TaxID=1825928 RepID=UPI001F0DE86F|nr:FAD-dependent oxidoreductase [Niabella hibiscisoli]MCH5719739.1 FAD-dependent oxidoreductase [Niabella hibiscisoli]
MNVVIIGGGIIGLAGAYYLRKAGLEVSVVDKNDITDGCSFGNIGYISPSHFIPLATPGIIKQGMKWMMSSSSPFFIKPRLNADLVRWGLAFRKSANKSLVETNAPHLNNLLQLSRQLMTDLKNDLEDFDLLEKGVFMLYKSELTGHHEKEMAEQAALFGLKTVVCNKQQVQDYETETEVDVAGGVLYLDDCHVNPAKLMQALYRRLREMGVHFYLNAEVTDFEKTGNKITSVVTHTQPIPADEVIIANGSWMGELSKLLGIRILLQPGKGYSMVYDQLAHNLQYPSILVDDRVATAPIDRWLRIGGTMEMSGHSDNILPKRVQSIYDAFKKYYPKMNLPQPDTSKAWFGYRPVSPDGLPYIGRHHQYKNLTYAGGHAMMGVSCATGTGILLNEIIQHQPTSIKIDAFSPERF